MNTNGGTKIWISIIVGVIIAFSGVTFGMIKGEQARATKEVKTQLIQVEQRIAMMNTRLYVLEGHYLVIIEKLDNLKVTLGELKESKE